MKKFLALLLALVMVFALAACGGTETTPTDTPDDSTVSEAPASEAPADGGEEATFLPGGGSNIVYVITPATSNVFFATEAEVARAKAEGARLRGQDRLPRRRRFPSARGHRGRHRRQGRVHHPR